MPDGMNVIANVASGFAPANAVPIDIWGVERGGEFGLSFSPLQQHPTATVTHSGSSTIAGDAGVLWSDPRLNWLNGDPVLAVPGSPEYGAVIRPTGAQNQQTPYISFLINKSEVEVMLVDFSPDGNDVTFVVDGMRVGAEPHIVSGGGYQFAKVANMGAGAHEVMVIVGSGCCVLQVHHAADAIVVRGEDWPLFSMGPADSYGDQGVRPYYSGLGLEIFLLTGHVPLPGGQGSTGLTNNAGGESGKSVFGSNSRMAALGQKPVEFVLTLGSVNDGLPSDPAPTESQLAAKSKAVEDAATALYARIAEVTDAPVIVMGVEPLGDSDDTSLESWNRNNAAVKRAAEAAPNVAKFVDWRDQDWLTGTGSASVPAGDGNQDIYIGTAPGITPSDTIHANLAGQRMIASRLVRAIQSVSSRL